ncbi:MULTISPECIES: putative bifunctional diguanylate cyclase/phosphodiesterase [Agrobacterium]|uniref:Diguanylate cyclase (GGDEF)-like protein/PAS domain S-box-containing protein n=2 Tax=Agrobacterium tumefaciens complex TaxID=1183400 RepID=A0AAW8LXV4_AGRTU|nr:MULTISPECIES: GGDEF and EAL domain-containing protein [Agrobacterium tumefaciens complex]MCP2136011.1 diguanylate cyclase (GGDEF)-like protein/PAS domain S-box-containing protein [Rhizobium sp. SLBN-94]TGE78651.1 GGDEF domain-containing protein [Rhizobium sp. SEMIA 439]KAA1232808.1 EAL domain-containing protein [Agrobacterium tumefaciens]KAB0458164.1 EAL domain-containing protein [Agrobacterium tumefaciens]KWT76781.1 diguanylate cyclase [Agrobacterium radiobacter]
MPRKKRGVTPSATPAMSENANPSDRHALLEAMIDHVPDFIYAKDLEGRFLFANRAIVTENGFDTVEQLIGLTDYDINGEAARRAGIPDTEARVMRTGEPDLGYEERAMRGDIDRWLMMSRVPLKDKAGNIIGVVGASRDITQKKASERLLQAQAHILEMIVAAARIEDFLEEFVKAIENLATGLACAVRVFDAADGEPSVYASPALAQEEGLAALVSSVSDPECLTHPAEHIAFSFDIPASEGKAHGFVWCMLASRKPEAALLEFIGAAARMAGLAIDRKRASEHIAFLADHDMLTRLPNRRFLDTRLPEILAAAAKTHRRVGIGFLDLDNFKQINDTLGHSIGDTLLSKTAERIAKSLRKNDLVLRVGGDEFVIILEEGRNDVEARLQRIRAAVSQPLRIGNYDIKVTCSIGMAFFPEHGETTAEIVAAADLAMYEAKHNGRDSIATFTPNMADDLRKKFTRIEELRKAVKRDEFVLHFQPQVDLVSGAISGVEALVRWQHPTEGLLGPAEFIGLAEETGLIVELGESILRKACRQAQAWAAAGLLPVKMAVNISPRQFQGGLVQQIRSVLKETGLAPSLLEIEITETLIIQDVETSVRIMRAIKQMGVSLALDDFGIGYSCLGMLKTFPLSCMKIDRSFLTHLPKKTKDSAIVSIMIQLAGSLGIDVIAEGVEAGEQAAFLRDAGCPYGQGYYFSRPVPAEVIEDMLAKKTIFPTGLTEDSK